MTNTLTGPFAAPMRLWMTYTQLAADAQAVVALRLLGMGGAWAVPASETTRMVSEKAPAFAEGWVSAMMTAWSGGSADRVMQAAIDPISTRAASNRNRLSRMGPSLMGTRLAPPRGKRSRKASRDPIANHLRATTELMNAPAQIWAALFSWPGLR